MRYADLVKHWARCQPVDFLCREVGIYPRQLQQFLDAPDPDPGLVVRLGALMNDIGPGPRTGTRTDGPDSEGHAA